MALLTRAEILAAQDYRTTVVSVPAWGGDVRLRTLTGADRERFELEVEAWKKSGTFSNLRSKLLAWTIVDENGNRIFSDEDINALGAKSTVPTLKLFQAATELNALTAEDVEQLKKT